MALAKFDLRSWEFTGQESESSEAIVLGLLWNKKDDTLCINPTVFDVDLPSVITERVILSITNKVSDPMGYACPVFLLPKMLLQKTWLFGLDWDTEVDEDTKGEFISWKSQLDELRMLKIPRQIVAQSSLEDSLSVHTFCDARASAYATAVFLREITEDGVTVKLVMANSRVPPTKSVTIPRLELLAATLGARLTNFVTESLPYKNVPVYLWTDSSTVLAWIQRTAQWNVFVWNRVQEIRRLTSPTWWRHVPGDSNPADLPPRGCNVTQLLSSKWWEGPIWLKQPEEEWPASSYIVDEELVSAALKKGACKTVSVVGVATGVTTAREEEHWYSNISDYRRIIRCMARVNRFISNCRKPLERKTGSLLCSEINDAEVKLIRHLRKEMFNGVQDDRLKTLNPLVNEKGVIRVKTKVFNREDTFNFRCPVVLDAKNIVIQRLIMDRHVQLCHAGVLTIVNSLRESYWVLSARRAVRSVIKDCTVCLRQNAKSMETSYTPLPLNRVRDASVFEISGVDCAGPLYLRSNEKASVVLYTCAVYRAIHFELVTSLATSAFLDALRRFIARRGRPAILYSDQGTNFVGANNLFRSLNWERICDFSTSRRIEWHFNPPAAPWWGGWWERLVRILKQLLRKVLGKASLNYEELMTVLIDCEAVINSRPITYVGGDGEELSALTPSMFLQEVREIGVSDCDYIDRKKLSRKLKYRQLLIDDLGGRFRAEYLGNLSYDGETRKMSRKLAVGEVVLIGDDNRKRIDWPLAKVLDIYPGKDGQCRVARLKTATGELIRPVQKIYPLEVSSCEQREIIWDRVKQKHEKVLENASLNSDEAGVSIENEDKPEITRSGRVVKKINRLNL